MGENRTTNLHTCRLPKGTGRLGLVPPRARCLPIGQTKTSPPFYVSRPIIQIWPSTLFPIPHYRNCLGFLDRLSSLLTCTQKNITLPEVFCTSRKRVLQVFAQL